jgi:hypothetical protein
MRHNLTAAFVAWSRGTPVEEIVAMFNIPRQTLVKVMKREGWAELQENAPMAVAPPAERKNVALQRCLENREANLKIAEKMRQDVAQVLDGLLQGKKLKRYWHNRGGVVEHEVEWGVADRVALANYFTMVANLTYRALGDREATSTATTSDKPADSPPPASITLVLPGAIADPRDLRPLKDAKAGHVVDLDRAFGAGPNKAQDDGDDGAPPGGKHFEVEAEVIKAQRDGLPEAD